MKTIRTVFMYNYYTFFATWTSDRFADFAFWLFSILWNKWFKSWKRISVFIGARGSKQIAFFDSGFSVFINTITIWRKNYNRDIYPFISLRIFHVVTTAVFNVFVKWGHDYFYSLFSAYKRSEIHLCDLHRPSFYRMSQLLRLWKFFFSSPKD